MAVVRRSARGLLVEGDDLVLIKRARPGQAPYLVTIGGGVEPEDASIEDALRREVWEEIGGTIDTIRRVLVVTDQVESGTGVQHLFVARLADMDLAARTGTEFAKPEHGGYEVVRVPFDTYALANLDTPIMPPAIASFLVANVDGLRDVLNTRADKE